MKPADNRPAAVAALATAGLAAVSLLAGCGSSPKPPGADPTLQVRNEPGVGNVLTDPEGSPLYAFTPDAQKRVTCTGQCSQTWLPEVVPDKAQALASPGVNAKLLGTVPEPGGGRQITYNRWPLYVYTGDATTFTVNGNGQTSFGGSWYAIRPDGTLTRP